MQLLDEMQTGGVEPDVISFNAVLSACEKAARGEGLASLSGIPSKFISDFYIDD